MSQKDVDSQPVSASPEVETEPLHKAEGSTGVKTDWRVFSVFVVIGCLQLAGWNAMLNVMHPLGEIINAPNLGEIIRWSYGAALFCVTAFFIKFDFIWQSVVYGGLALTSFFMLLFSVVLQANPNAVLYVYPFLGVGLAVAAGMIGSAGFGFASQFPKDYSGAMSAGLGVSGIVMFGLSCLSLEVIFPQKSVTDITASMWFLSTCTTILAIGATLAFYFLFNMPSTVAWFSKQSSLNDKTDCELNAYAKKTDVEDDYEIGGLSYILKKAWTMGIPTFLCLFITLTIFPVVGPLKWSTNQSIHLYLVGLYTLGDLIGRYLPNVVPQLMVSRFYTHIISYLRFIFIIFSLLSALYRCSPFLGALWFHILQIFLLALTNGWMSTVTFVRTVEMVNGDGAKKRIASFCLLCVTGSILVSQGLSYFISNAVVAPACG